MNSIFESIETGDIVLAVAEIGPGLFDEDQRSIPARTYGVVRSVDKASRTCTVDFGSDAGDYLRKCDSTMVTL